MSPQIERGFRGEFESFSPARGASRFARKGLESQGVANGALCHGFILYHSTENAK